MPAAAEICGLLSIEMEHKLARKEKNLRRGKKSLSPNEEASQLVVKRNCSRLQSRCGNRSTVPMAVDQAAEEIFYFVIPSAARSLSSISVLKNRKKERFLASLGMTEL